MSFKTSNPAFTTGTIYDDWSRADARSTTMTVQGTALKGIALLAVLTATASITWSQVGRGQISLPWILGGLGGGFVFFLITIFKPSASPITGPLYAACQGLLLGAVSRLFDLRFPGIAFQAVSFSIATLLVMLVLYGTRMIRVTEKLRAGIIAATCAVCLAYFVAFILRLFHVHVPFLYDSSPLSIGISLFVVGLAAFNLLLDFDFIERQSYNSAPKWMEWYGAFGLMVTLIWLYLEILRLLAKLQSRND
jgi:uncharacterized YccA/Bax inhibitor family protein